MNGGRRRVAERLYAALPLLGDKTKWNLYVDPILKEMKEHTIFLDDITAISGLYQGYFAHVKSQQYESPANDANLVEKQDAERLKGVFTLPHKRCTDLVYAFNACGEEFIKRGIYVVFNSTRATAFRVLLDTAVFSRGRPQFKEWWRVQITRMMDMRQFLEFHFDIKWDTQFADLLQPFVDSRVGFFFSMINNVPFFPT